MEEKPNYYAIIPASIRYDNELRANEKLLYGEITALTQKTGECWASNKYFCELYDVKPNAVATWLRHLKEKKYIEIDYEFKGKEIEKRIIKIGGIQKDMTYSQKDMGVFTKRYGGTIQKGEENNTSNNITSINNTRKENIKRYFDNDTINELFIEFLNQRKKLKAVNSERAISNLINKLKEYPEEVQIEMINNSITNSWKGIFPLKGTDIKKNNNKEQWEIIKAIENGQIKYTSNESIEDDFYI